MKAVGIDIGSSSIKIVEVDYSNKGLVITGFQEQIIGQNPAFDPEVEIIDFLRNLAPRYNSKQWRIAVGMKQEKVAVRNKIFPFSERIKILKSLPFELEEDLPFAPDNAIYDAKIVMRMGNSAEVLACATPKSRILESVLKMKDIGLDMAVLSPEGIAFANCVENWAEAPPLIPGTQVQIEGDARPERDIQIVINIGHTRTFVCAFDGLSIIGIRTIFWGGKNIADMIAQRYEISYIQALKELSNSFILLNQENANYDQVVFSNNIADCFKELTRELKITLLEFQSEFNAHIRHISITGGASSIQNLHAFMTTQLETPVNRFRTLSYFNTVGIEKNDHMEAVCGVALGLALEALKKPKNPALNLLKDEYQKQNKELQQIWSDWGTVAKISLGLIVTFGIYTTIRDSVAGQLNEAVEEAVKKQTKEFARLPAKQQNINGLRNYLKDERKKSVQIKALQSISKMNSALDIFKRVSDAVPAKNNISLTVTKLNIVNTKIEIEGSVNSGSELENLRSALAQVSANGKIDEIQATQRPPSGTPFAFSFTVDRGATAGSTR